MRCLPGSNDCALPYYRKPYASTIPPPIFSESNACFNFNFKFKLAPAAAEWSETMPRLPAERLRVSRKGIPKHCLVRSLSSGIRAIEKPRNRHLPGFDREPRGPGQRPGVEPDEIGRASCRERV